MKTTRFFAFFLCLSLLLSCGLLTAAAEEKYRSVQVYQLEGEAEVLRNSASIQPYLNMMLENEDHVSTFSESWIYLKMDEDKYLLAEPETRFLLQASGSGSRTRTVIRLESGALISHLVNPLQDGSSYEVVTPNSTMAVRGTSFRVYVWFDSDGVSHTLLQVFEGTVAVQLLYPDGSLSTETRFFKTGQAIRIWGNDTISEYEEGPFSIRYSNLHSHTLEFLGIGIQNLSGYDISAFALGIAKRKAALREDIRELWEADRRSYPYGKKAAIVRPSAPPDGGYSRATEPGPSNERGGGKNPNGGPDGGGPYPIGP